MPRGDSRQPVDASDAGGRWRRGDGSGQVIAGLPAGTWILMAFAVVPGIALVTLAYRVHRSGDERAAADMPQAPPRQGTRRG